MFKVPRGTKKRTSEGVLCTGNINDTDQAGQRGLGYYVTNGLHVEERVVATRQ
jgi:hypothetical protein